MKSVWNKLSELSRYYIVSMIGFFILWSIMTVLNIEFYNVVFVLLSYVWHFALLTPGLKEKMLKQRFSFLSVVVRVNYYLQLFINIKRVSFGPAIVRSLSPLIFTFVLMVATGNGNPVFTIIGSLCFEVIYALTKKAVLDSTTISILPNDPETPPEIPHAENSHE